LVMQHLRLLNVAERLKNTVSSNKNSVPSDRVSFR
jgi:hypothetical protein